jgi:hypothetical protein
MMIRQSTRHGQSMQKHGKIACTKTLSMQNKVEMRVVVVQSDQGV